MTVMPGLGSHSEAVYRLVLDRPYLQIGEISARLGLTEREVGQACQHLMDLHLLHRSDTGPGRFCPVTPEARLAALLRHGEEDVDGAELTERPRGDSEARALARVLAQRYSGSGHVAAEVGERIVGVEAIRERLAGLGRRAQREWLAVVPANAPMLDPQGVDTAMEQDVLGRGVEVRSLYQDSFRNDPATLRYVRDTVGLGAQTRTVPTLPVPMMIMDGEVALIPLDPQDPVRGVLELRNAGVVTTLRMMFEQFWTEASPWDEAVVPDSAGLTRRDRALLLLLSSGHTDDAISRRLGISLRTVRRVVADLMTRLEARSRFEAGVQAVRSGWL
jgi:DNA-binding CsgD family transcriptional regulator